MWDGSFRAKKQVSLRGKSSRQADRDEVKDRVKRERELRARDKLEQRSAVVAQAVARSFAARAALKRRTSREWADKMSDLRKLRRALPSFAPPAQTALDLVSMFLFSFDDRRGDLDASDALDLCALVESLVASEGAARLEAGLHGRVLRCAALAAVLMRLLVLVCDDSWPRDASSNDAQRMRACICSALVALLEGRDRAHFRAELFARSEPPHARGVLPTEALHALLSPDADETTLSPEERACAQLLCAGAGEAGPRARMSDVAGALLALRPAALERLGLDKTLRAAFAPGAWAAALTGLVDTARRSDARSLRVLENALRLARESTGSDAAARAPYWRAAAQLVGVMCPAAQRLDEAVALRSPETVQRELSAALALGEPGPALALVSLLEAMRRSWTAAPTAATTSSGGAGSRQQQALASLSPANAVVGAVAFAGRDAALVRGVWRPLLRALDGDAGAVRSEALLALGEPREVAALIAFACAATCQLLPALDDRELFEQQRPFKVDELRDMALFLRHVLHEGLWAAAAPEGQLVAASSESNLPPLLAPELLGKAVELYDQLYDRHCRHRIMDDAAWLFPVISTAELGVDARYAMAPAPLPGQPTGADLPPLLVIPGQSRRARPAGHNRTNRNGARDDDGDAVMAQPLAASARRPHRRNMSLDDVQGNADDDDEEEDDDEEDDGPSAAVVMSPEAASARVKRLLQELPLAVPFEQRVQVFDHFLATDDAAADAHHRSPFHHGGTVARARVWRDRLYDDAFLALGAESLRGRVQIEFVSQHGVPERGIDGGGLFKEFLMEFARQAFDPARGLWRQTPHNELYPNASSGRDFGADHLAHFAFIGRVLGKAVHSGILLELDFAAFFLNSMLGKRNHLHDLQSRDDQLYRNLVALKNVPDPGALELTFSAALGDGAEGALVDLVPGGRDVAVTRDNYIYYIARLASFRLNEEARAQTDAFMSGFSELVSAGWLHMFKARELQLVIGGARGGFSVADLKRHVTYRGYHASQPYVEQFWEVVEEFTDEQRALLLRFVTSCSKPPLQGFMAMSPPICIGEVAGEGAQERLPSASTCVNYLKLPRYGSKEVLREKLLYAISSGSGFELS